MHNVKRFSAAKRAEMRQENEERAAQYRALSKAAFERRTAKLHDQETLQAITKVVTENTDFATMWNFRREVLQTLYPAVDDQRKAACVAEFELTQLCLGRNPKSYPVWYHRQWVLEWGECSWQWPVELKLTAKFLALDDRNFHCWTYRRFVVAAAGVSAESELAFSTGKIEANFSNYSAWHYRSKLLPAIHGACPPGANQVAWLRDELQLVRNAFFTEPNDSSAWFYHRWLLAQLKPDGAAPAPQAEYEATLREELSMCDELIELEGECKWVLAASAYIARELGEAGTTGVKCMETLRRIDPVRKRYYEDVSSGAKAETGAAVEAS